MLTSRLFPILSALLLCAALRSTAAEEASHVFKKTQLSDKFWCEGATFGDFNHDQKMDIVSGPYWYEGPEFKKRHEYYPATNTFARKQPDGTTVPTEGFEGALGVNHTYSDNSFPFQPD